MASQSRMHEVGGPPRVRRNRRAAGEHRHRDGWTSARAEEPCSRSLAGRARWVDLRACGGTEHDYTKPVPEGGGPPRVRRNHDRCCGGKRQLGWTSARAEEP